MIVYSIVYIVPGTPLVTVPVVASIVAPSVGTGLKANVPPDVPVIEAVAPSQVGVKVKEALPELLTVTVSDCVKAPLHPESGLNTFSKFKV